MMMSRPICNSSTTTTSNSEQDKNEIGLEKKSILGPGSESLDGTKLVHTPSGALQPIDHIIRAPYEYILQIPGKGFRGRLVDVFNTWLQVPADKVESVKHIVDKLHNASLLIDDIEDNSNLRRGVPVAHTVYGVPMTINSANFIYFEALQDTRQLGSLAAMDVFMDEIMRLHRGQGMDIYWRDNNVCPTYAEYSQMVLDKTGGLFRLSVGLLQAFSHDKRDYSSVCNDLGLFYQVMGDYLNLQSDKYHHNKSFAEDLTEGKFSFPIVHAIRDGADDTVFNVLKRHTRDADLKRFAIDRMQRCGSFSYTVQFLDEVKTRLQQELARLGGNPGLEKLVDYWYSELPPPQPVAAAATVMAPFEPKQV